MSPITSTPHVSSGLFTHYFLPTGTVGPILSLYETAEPLTRDEFERRRALAEMAMLRVN